MDVVVAVTATTAVIGCVIAVLGFFRTGRSDVKADGTLSGEILTKLDFMQDDVKDIKAEYRRTREDIDEVRGIAMHAQERADAAHNRLDRAGVDALHV